MLRVPQACDGRFSMEIFRRYQRSEQAFVLSLMEMVVNGVFPGPANLSDDRRTDGSVLLSGPKTNAAATRFFEKLFQLTI